MTAQIRSFHPFTQILSASNLSCSLLDSTPYLHCEWNLASPLSTGANILHFFTFFDKINKVLYHSISKQIQKQFSPFFVVQVGLMENVNEEQHSWEEFDFGLMKVELDLFELFVWGTDIAEGFHDVADVRTSTQEDTKWALRLRLLMGKEVDCRW